MITFDPRLVIGPVQIGALLSAGFYGCFVAQTVMYFKLFPKDPLTLKIIVNFCRIVVQSFSHIWTGDNYRVRFYLLCLML
jgi:hypothetical protein